MVDAVSLNNTAAKINHTGHFEAWQTRFVAVSDISACGMGLSAASKFPGQTGLPSPSNGAAMRVGSEAAAWQ